MATTHVEARPGAYAPTRPSVAPVLADWRAWVTNHWFGASLIAGFVATHLATVFGLFFRGIGIPNLNWPVTNGMLALGADSTTTAQFWVGEFIHGIDGLVFAFLFALLIHPRIPLPNTPMGNMVKAVGYSVVLAVISAGFLVPYVYFPHAGAGIFSFDAATSFGLADAGWKVPFAILLWHLVYGFFLGTLYNPNPWEERGADVHL
jgi:hypothetical protein